MTTPPTPADWYSDPENPAGLRYWDGTSWTEHRAPAPVADSSADAGPDAQQGGAHRADEASPEPSGTSWSPTPSQPYDTHPPTAYEPPSYESTPPSWDAPPRGEQPYAPPPTRPFAGPPPPGASSGGPNRKLVFGILGGAAVLLLALVLVIVFVVIRQDEPTVTSSQTTSSSTSESTSTENTSETSSKSSATESATPPPTGAEGSDGDYTFSVASTETGDTITSTVSDDVETTADGTFYVVYLDVANTGTSPLTFVATFQQLNAAGQLFSLDDEATAFLGGTIAQIAPGEQVETPLVYDVPVGTEPESILLRANPSTGADPFADGVEVPLR